MPVWTSMSTNIYAIQSEDLWTTVTVENCSTCQGWGNSKDTVRKLRHDGNVYSRKEVMQGTHCDWNIVFVLMVTDPVETVVKPYLLRWVPCSIDITQLVKHCTYLMWPRAHGNSAFHLSGVSKWVPALAEKAKEGMVHSVSGCTWGVQVRLRSLENACHTWEP